MPLGLGARESDNSWVAEGCEDDDDVRVLGEE